MRVKTIVLLGPAVAPHVLPRLFGHSLVAQFGRAITLEAADAEAVLRHDVIARVVVEVGRFELFVGHHLQHLVHQFKPAHDEHQMVGVRHGGVALVAENACSRVVAEYARACEQAVR